MGPEGLRRLPRRDRELGGLRREPADAGEARTERLPLLVDQGDADDFLDEQLKPELLRGGRARPATRWSCACSAGYDHSYYFIASFIGDHVAHHARALHAAASPSH